MTVDPLVLLTILGMALATYATRVSGLVLVGRLKPSARVQALLGYIPGSVLVSIVAPTVFTSGPAEALAAAATLLVALRTRNLPLAMLVGVVCVVVLRALVSAIR